MGSTVRPRLTRSYDVDSDRQTQFCFTRILDKGMTLADFPDNPRPQVCVVDDDVSMLATIAAMLEGQFEVSAARGGRDGLRLVRRNPPDLVLLDIHMPDLDGFTVCRHLKDDPLTADIPVVFLTVDRDIDNETRGLLVGAHDFIAKPPHGPVLAARVGNLVRMKRLADRLKKEARSDGLTGLANHNFFISTLGNELLRARRAGKPLSLLMFDVDYFKAYNDMYGHLSGDGVLSRVGQLLRDLAHRPSDMAGRLGGEEFALLLPDTPVAGAKTVAKHALEALASLAIPHAGSPVSDSLSFSIGIATQEHACTEYRSCETNSMPLVGDAASELLARADAALYRAKHLGRNRVVVEQDDMA